MRETNYAKELTPPGSITWGNGEGRIERLLVKNTNEEEIRFSWWTEGRLIPRPLDLSEEDLLQLIQSALENGVFTEDFCKRLKAML